MVFQIAAVLKNAELTVNKVVHGLFHSPFLLIIIANLALERKLKINL